MTVDAFTYYSSFSMADDSRSKIWFDAVRKVGLSKPSPTVIEVGVGQGGRMALAALALTKSCNQLDSEIFGFDRFANPLGPRGC